MHNVFAPLVLSLTFFNVGHWMSEKLLPLYFTEIEGNLISSRHYSVSPEEVWSLTDLVSSPVLEYRSNDFIYFALEFAESVPEFKTCFPEIVDEIMKSCSEDTNFISEYQYVVMALRMFNCLHHRSMGIQEIDFEFIDEDYAKYLAVMSNEEQILYQKMYNVARGLCLNIKRDRDTIRVRRTVKNIEMNVEQYLNLVKKIEAYLASSFERNIKKGRKKQRIGDVLINQTGKLMERIQEKADQKYSNHIKVTKDCISRSTSYIENIKSNLDLVRRNFRKLDRRFKVEGNLDKMWMNFAQEYSRKTMEMDEKLARIQMKVKYIN